MVAAMLRLFPVLLVAFLVYILRVREVVKFLGAMAKSHQVRLLGSKRRQLRIRYGSVTIAAYLLVFLASERGVSLLLRGIPEWVRVTLWMHVEMPAMLFFVAGFVLLISVWTIPSVSLESESERGCVVRRTAFTRGLKRSVRPSHAMAVHGWYDYDARLILELCGSTARSAWGIRRTIGPVWDDPCSLSRHLALLNWMPQCSCVSVSPSTGKHFVRVHEMRRSVGATACRGW
jgi:hypothetical protein